MLAKELMAYIESEPDSVVWVEYREYCLKANAVSVVRHDNGSVSIIVAGGAGKLASTVGDPSEPAMVPKRRGRKPKTI